MNSNMVKPFKTCQAYLCVFAVLAIVGCGRGADDEGLTHDEVRAINERVLEKAIGQPDSALMMIERLRAGDFSVIDTTGASLQWSGPLPDYRCDYLRAKVYGQTLERMWLDSAIIIGERLMTTNAAQEDLAYRQDVLEMLIHACRQHRDDEQTIHWSAQLIDLCRQNGDETEAHYFALKAQKAIDKLWDEGVINEETIEQWGEEHMRTPYGYEAHRS